MHWTAARANPDISLIITDWEMLGVSGIEFAHRYREEFLDKVPIILNSTRTRFMTDAEHVDALAKWITEVCDKIAGRAIVDVVNKAYQKYAPQ